VDWLTLEHGTDALSRNLKKPEEQRPQRRKPEISYIDTVVNEWLREAKQGY